MKLTINLTRIREEYCELEVPGLEDAKGAIESLRPDDFAMKAEYRQLEIINKQGEDVAGLIQPFCPNL